MTPYENEQHTNETTERKLDAIVDELRMDNVRVTTTLAYVQSELREHKTEVHISLGKLNDKIDQLSNRFNDVASEVKVMAAKIAFGAIALGMALQVLGKHFGLI